MTERGQGNRWLPGIALCLGTISIAACQKTPDTPPPPAASSSSAAAPAPAQAYVPPTAEQLYQLVAPIALFPDKLVAQTLAASAYPDQVTAAQAWMQQNRQLAPAALIDAANAQPWDPSVKSLTAFPNVVDQLARNVDWTTALGDAYVNDPTDVLNAIQVMRQRAQSHGNLASTPQQKVAVRDRSGDDVSVFDGDPGPVVYSGPAVVPAPQRTIVIEPEQDNVVYVPSYDPGVVYGDDVTIYRGYDYRPAPRYSTGQVVAAGLVSFGVGVLVGEAFSHHDDRDRRDWGWHAWNMNWGGGPDRGPGRPAVVYNDRPYVSHSTTVINRVTNNTTINRIDNRHDFGNDNRHDFGNDNRNITVNRPPPSAAPGNPAFQAQAQQRPGPGARPAPDFEHMQRPSFTDRMTRPGQPVPAQSQERPDARERAAQAGMAAAPGQSPRMPDPRLQEQQRDQQMRAQQQQAQQQERQQQERGRQQQDQQREQARGQEQQQQQRAQQERAQQQQRVQQDQQRAQQQDRMQQERAQQQQRSQQQDQQRLQQQGRAQQEQRAQQQDRAQQQQRAQQQEQQRGQQQQERAEMAAREQQHREQPRPQPAQRPQPEHHDVPHPHKDEKKDDHN